jgi:hypothetical protein
MSPEPYAIGSGTSPDPGRGPAIDPSTLLCPQCRQIDQVQKVSTVYATGTTYTTGVGMGGGLIRSHRHRQVVPMGGM